MSELLEQVPIDFICVAVLGVLGLRRLIRMESYHELRVVILTGLLWVPAIYLFLLACPPQTECDYINFKEKSDAYTITEM